MAKRALVKRHKSFVKRILCKLGLRKYEAILTWDTDKKYVAPMEFHDRLNETITYYEGKEL